MKFFKWIWFNFKWYKWLLYDQPIFQDAVINGVYSSRLRKEQQQKWRENEPKWS